MLSQPVWDQLLETEKKKVKALEESYAERMRSNNVSGVSFIACFGDQRKCRILLTFIISEYALEISQTHHCI